MRIILVLIILVASGFSGCKTSKPLAERKSEPTTTGVVAPGTENQQPDFSDPETWLIGNFNVSQLARQPHSSWYLKGKDEYSFDPEAVKMLKELVKPGLSIKIVLGTWCPDSRREVPRFMRIAEAINFPADKIQFIGVDNMKISPVENYDALNIQRVPTFILYRNNIEAGRIIEVPVTSLEQDMIDILTRNEK